MRPHARDAAAKWLQGLPSCERLHVPRADAPPPRALAQADNEVTSRMLDGLLHYETVTSYNRQPREVQRFEESFATYQEA